MVNRVQRCGCESYDRSVPFTVFPVTSTESAHPADPHRLLKLQHQPPRSTDWPHWLLYFSVKEQPDYWVASDTVPPGSKEGRLGNQKSRMITKTTSTSVRISSLLAADVGLEGDPLNEQFGSGVLSHLFCRKNAHCKRLSHKLYATLMTSWISALSLRGVSPVLRIYSPSKASSFRTFLTTRRRLGRAEAWLDGRGVGAGSGCYELRNFWTNKTKRVLNCTFKTRSIALAQPPALLLPGGPDMCIFFQPNSQWFNFNDVTGPGNGARRLGFIFFCC